jgi:hypothetical protein
MGGAFSRSIKIHLKVIDMGHRFLKDWQEAFNSGGPGYVPLTATSGGVKIPEDRGSQLVVPTWGSASNKLILPSPQPGTIVMIAGAATGGVLETNATATVTVNGATSVKVAPNQAVYAICESATAWKAFGIASDGSITGLGDSTAAKVLRTRVTTAQVNSGATLLPALPGLKYRVQDMALIAIGGAAATATSVDIIATQSASGVNLLAAAVAGLTQNTLLRAGATNAAILAAGASFVANDANTAITIGKTGSSLATATHIDVLLTYTIENA